MLFLVPSPKDTEDHQLFIDLPRNQTLMVKLPKELRASLGRRAQAENRRENKDCKRMNVRAEEEQKRGRE